MELYPAIDLLDGRCVRLRRGDFDQVTVYSDKPLEVAAAFSRAGARWIHVVDLNGARSGMQTNLPIIREISKTSGIRLQMGGGLRTADAVRRALQGGVSRCVIGTAAIDPALLQHLGKEFGGRLAVGMDVDGGTVRVSGWEQDSGVSIERFLDAVGQAAIGHVVATDISRDGMLSGPNLALLRDVSAHDFRVIASGGVSSLDDLELLAAELPDLEGVIVGKAIYEEKFGVSEALQRLRHY
ncbi:MAG: 1-(5-phosphoribosyl)-5-[(5-phosphoribosylamino)methylideneamino]imidazole-4-carboxamide isomerase [Acidobacteria bacterium]|nr:1-(5-phosphoribosyl)-5-[(5-phosphoribosylamino)methylideneamino]imidazole-4-carboxamide isomerase [Acidobacteriota bacterium]